MRQTNQGGPSLAERLANQPVILPYLWTLFKNAILAAIGLIVIVSLKGGLPAANLTLLLFVAAFLKSIFDQLSGGKDSAVLQILLQILLQIVQQQPSAAGTQRASLGDPRNPYDH